MIFYDTETCGLHGPIVLLQYAVDDGPIILYEPWKEPIRKTMELIEWMMEHEVCGFNLSFDHFHLCQMYTTLSLLDRKDAILESRILDYALAEPMGRDGQCLKPKAAMDLMLHARKGPYQTLMNREGIRIKRVPTVLAWKLAELLEKRIDIDAIYFARKKDREGDHWSVYDIEDEDGDIDPNFKDIVLNFRPSTALKVLAQHALNIPKDQILLFGDIDLEPHYWPEEHGYAPFALAIGNPDDGWNGAWPEKINYHIAHWNSNHAARKYATNDIIYTRGLWEFFGRPPAGDDDSELACMVGAARWKGFAVDLDGIKELKAKAEKKIEGVPTYHVNVKRWIDFDLDESEKVVFKSTGKVELKKLLDDPDFVVDCPECKGEAINCSRCNNEGFVPHPAKVKIKLVLDAREAERQIDLFNKLLLAGRLHADLNVIGTKSSRMSGTGGLNVQGINKSKEIRSRFTMAFDNEELDGGDFSAFEVVLAIAVWGDKKLEETVQREINCAWCNGEGKECKECKGKGKSKIKIHALFGTFLYPDKTYEDIVRSDGSNDDRYTKAKSGLFAVMYGGEAYTLATRLGVTEEAAEAGYQEFIKEFPVVGQKRNEIFSKFRSLSQPNGIGSQVVWKDPAEYIEEPILGHRRYFTLENQICKALFDLASNPPPELNDSKIKVMRRDRLQTAGGAVRSALYACAFAIQGQTSRAAANHVIQSAGAKITKAVQRRIWDLQPSGVNEWIVRPLNIHDEILVAARKGMSGQIEQIVKDCVREFKSKVPLLAIDWKSNISSWAGKK